MKSIIHWQRNSTPGAHRIKNVQWLRSLFLLSVIIVALVAVQPRLDAQPLPTQHWDLAERFKSYIHESWGFEHGFPQNEVLAIEKSGDGYLWFGTQSGLVRFNGVTFKSFDRYNTPALKNEFIRRLSASADSGLWIGTDHGGLAFLRNGIMKEEKFCDSASAGATRVVLVTRDGSVLISVPGLGVWKGKDGKWKQLNIGRPLLSTWACFEDSDGSIWLGENGAVVHLAGESVKWYERDAGLPDAQVIAISRDAQGSILIGTVRHGFYVLRDARVKPGSAELRIATIRAFCNDSKAGTWIGSVEKGLFHYDGVNVKPCLLNQTGTPLSVISLMHDEEGSLWIGTAGDGIHRLRLGSVEYIKIKEPSVPEEVWGVLVHDDEMWIGTWQSGIRRFAGGKMLRPPSPEKLAHSIVGAFFREPNGTLWIGTHAGLFRMCSGVTEEILTPEGKSLKNAYAIQRDSNGTLWVGGEGLFRISDNKALMIAGLPTGILINYLLIDHQKKLWIGSDGHGVGLFVDGRVSFAVSDSTLTSNTILCLFEDKDGGILAGTQGGGLNRLKGAGWVSMKTDDGLLDNFVNTIIRGDDGRLWMSTNKGLFGIHEQLLIEVAERRVDKLTGVSIEARDGLHPTEFGGGLQSCSAKSPDGTLWFISLKGLVGYNPKNAKSNLPPPPVRIETIEVNGKPQTLIEGMGLEPGVRSVHIGFAGLSFVVPTATRFRYMLDGYDDDWTESRNQRQATYTNLSPGTYVFRVSAANGDGEWNSVPAHLTFTILPRFSQTLAFKATLALLMITALHSLYRFRVWRMLKREEILKNRVEEAVANIKILHGLIPICAHCKKMRDDKGYWNDVTEYITEHSEAVLSHGICPACAEELYGDQLKRIRDKKANGTWPGGSSTP
jgi:ligand-binding sensor domain-containing protein